MAKSINIQSVKLRVVIVANIFFQYNHSEDDPGKIPARDYE
jgi:hypothetical protein